MLNRLIKTKHYYQEIYIDLFSTWLLTMEPASSNKNTKRSPSEEKNNIKMIKSHWRSVKCKSKMYFYAVKLFSTLEFLAGIGLGRESMCKSQLCLLWLLLVHNQNETNIKPTVPVGPLRLWVHIRMQSSWNTETHMSWWSIKHTGSIQTNTNNRKSVDVSLTSSSWRSLVFSKWSKTFREQMHINWLIAMH